MRRVSLSRDSLPTPRPSEPARSERPSVPPPPLAPHAESGPTRKVEPHREIINAFWDKHLGAKLAVVERDASGEARVRHEQAEHVSFVRRAELSDALARSLRASSRVLSMREDGAFWRIRWRDRWSCLEAASKGGPFERAGVEMLEADVDPVRRFLTEHDVDIARPRRVYLDVEADARVSGQDKEKARMLAWALVDERGEKVASAVLPEDTDEAERALLEALWAALAPFDQVVAWAGDFYDFPYVTARTRRHRLRVEERRWLWLDQLVLFRRMNLGGIGDEKQSMRLDDVAKSLKVGAKSTIDEEAEARELLACLLAASSPLHDVYLASYERTGKIAISGAHSWDLWAAGGAARRLLLTYCEHDTALCRAIETKTGFCSILVALAQASRCFADSAGLRPSTQVEGFMLMLGRDKGVRFPTHHFTHEEREQFMGAYVLEPTRKGIVRDVHVCDFARLYPSVAMTFNLSPETTRGRQPRPPSYVAQRDPIPDGCAVVPLSRVIVAQDPRGLLPTAFEELLKLRDFWKKKKATFPPGSEEWIDADRRSDAYKRAINAFFGVMGLSASRFFQKDTAESMTQGGAWLLKETLKAAEQAGFESIYGDTDSAFIVGLSDEQFAAFVKRCNAELYPRLLRERGATRNFIELAYEKKLAIALFLGKKRYAARYAHYDGKPATKDSKLEVKGLEYRRGDTVRLARELQLEAIEMILREEIVDPKAYVALLDRHKVKILEGELSLEDVMLAKRLAKPLGMYAKRVKLDGEEAAQAAHVEVARVLKERGRDVQKGSKIEYVVTDGAANPAVAIPTEDFDGSFDRYYLWEQLVYPPTLRVLQAAFADFDWSPWERVRPRVPRRTARAVSPDQLGFGFD